MAALSMYSSFDRSSTSLRAPLSTCLKIVFRIGISVYFEFAEHDNGGYDSYVCTVSIYTLRPPALPLHFLKPARPPYFIQGSYPPR